MEMIGSKKEEGKPLLYAFSKLKFLRLTPGFHFAALKDATPYIVEEGKRFINQINELMGAPIEAKKVFTSITLRVIIKTAFGGEFDPTWMEVELNINIE